MQHNDTTSDFFPQETLLPSAPFLLSYVVGS